MTDLPSGAEPFVADWTGADEIPPAFVNQILTQVGLPAGESATPEGVYITFGVAQPPVVYGNDELQAEQTAAYKGRLKVRPIARLVLSRDRVIELQRVLQIALDKFDETAREFDEAAKKQKKDRSDQHA